MLHLKVLTLALLAACVHAGSYHRQANAVAATHAMFKRQDDCGLQCAEGQQKNDCEEACLRRYAISGKDMRAVCNNGNCFCGFQPR